MLEQNLELYGPVVSRERQTTYFVVGDLEGLSASALYTGHLPPLGQVGSSSFNVELPKSNVVDRSLKISTPEEILIINQTQRIKGVSGIDYFNIDGSLAGRILGLNKSERDYLED